jgi:hypothetical protein
MIYPTRILCCWPFVDNVDGGFFGHVEKQPENRPKADRAEAAKSLACQQCQQIRPLPGASVSVPRLNVDNVACVREQRVSLPPFFFTYFRPSFFCPCAQATLSTRAKTRAASYETEVSRKAIAARGVTTQQVSRHPWALSLDWQMPLRSPGHLADWHKRQCPCTALPAHPRTRSLRPP